MTDETPTPPAAPRPFRDLTPAEKDRDAEFRRLTGLRPVPAAATPESVCIAAEVDRLLGKR